MHLVLWEKKEPGIEKFYFYDIRTRLNQPGYIRRTMMTVGERVLLWSETSRD